MGYQHQRTLFGAMLLAFALAANAAEVTIAVTASGLSLPVDVAQAQGFFALEGVAVRVIDCSTGPKCMQLLFSHAAQLVTVSEVPVVSASFERNDYAILSTIAQSTSNIRIIGRKSSGISRAEDLARKRIGVIVGSSSHYYLDSFLLFHGMDPKAIDLVALLPEQIATAVEQHQIDAFAGYSRHAGPVVEALGRDGIVLEDPHIYTESYALVVERSLLKSKSEEIVKVLRALDRAERFIAKEPQRAKQVWHLRTSLDHKFIDAIFPSFTYRLGLDQSLLATMEGEARWAVREGHVKTERKVVNYLDLVELGPLKLASPSAMLR